jgi:4-amino-4-deoxy-L-arabinose transferase-like glycosyltransferase
MSKHLDRKRLKSGLLLAGAIGFAILGQFYLTQRREYVWDGIIFFALALICFGQAIAVASRSTRKDSQSLTFTWRERGQQLLRQPQTLAVGVALLANLIAARSANTQHPPADYTFSVLLWLASLVLLFLTFAPLSRLSHDVRHAVRQIRPGARNRQRDTAELALILGLILFGLVLRAWDLEHIPANLSGDEGTQGMWAVDVLRGQLRNPFATGWFTVPTMSFFAQAASLRLFGETVAGLRALSALIGTVTLAFTYLLARRCLRRRVALFALAALTFNHYHIHFSRLGSNQIADAFFAVLTLWLLTEGLHRANEKRQRNTQHATRTTRHAPQNAHPWFLAAGLTLGLSWYGYFGSRVILLIVVVYLTTQAIANRRRSFRHYPLSTTHYPLPTTHYPLPTIHSFRALTLMALMALMAVSPLLLHYADFPQNLSARFNQVSFFRWLQNELNRPDHASTLELVIRQVWRSISAFNHTLDPTFWYRAQIPLLDFVSGILFILGLAVAFSRWRRPGVRLILIWFALAILFGWVLTENPPSSMRLVIAAPAVALLTALGLDRLLSLAQWAIGGRRADWNFLGLTALSIAALLNVYYYFGVYTPTRIYGNPSAETATVLARHLRQVSAATSSSPSDEPANSQDTLPFVYFYGPPFLYYDFGAISFIARGVPGLSVPPAGEDPDFQIQVSQPTLFVVLRERLGELATIQARYPNGQLREFHSEVDRRLMFVIYQVQQ